MALDYSTATATGLLAAIRDVTYAGNSNRDWDDPKILRLINRMTEERLVPLVMGARKNHFVTSTDIPLVQGQRAYLLPSKATGMKTRALQLVDAHGNPFGKLVERELEDAINFGGP